MSAWESSVKTDEWYTPKYIFDALEVRFDMDVAAPQERTYCHVPTSRFICFESLERDIWEGFVWCNPPFGGRNAIQKWIDKMAEHGNGIILTPDRTSTEWWHSAAIKCHGMLFIKGKIKFIKPNGSLGLSPSTGITLFAFGWQALEALRRAEINKLGILRIN
jgi:DNA N-6-adenine-methyltransferase (Dam)